MARLISSHASYLSILKSTYIWSWERHSNYGESILQQCVVPESNSTNTCDQVQHRGFCLECSFFTNSATQHMWPIARCSPFEFIYKGPLVLDGGFSPGVDPQGSRWTLAHPKPGPPRTPSGHPGIPHTRSFSFHSTRRWLRSVFVFLRSAPETADKSRCAAAPLPPHYKKLINVRGLT
jgi:hypothetical protein